MEDLPLLLAWQSNPHVREWWGSGAPFGESDLNDPRIDFRIVETAGRPFAFMQDYDVHGWPAHHFTHLPEGARGIDQYIGPPEMIGRGYGTAFIAARMRALFAGGAPVIALDPHPENKRAIAVYRKLGFRVAGAPRETEWGLIVPMETRAAGPGALQRKQAEPCSPDSGLEDQMDQYTGGCLCGQVRFTAAGRPYRTGICHCNDCRKHHGALFYAAAVFPESAVTVTGDSHAYQGRHFCPRCGSSVFARSEDEIELHLGALDDPGQLIPTYESWTLRRPGWLPSFQIRQYERDRTATPRREA